MNNLVKRTIFGSLFVIVVIGSILVNFWAFFIVMTASVFLGVKEVNRLLSKDIESKSELPSLIYSMSVFVLSSVALCAWYFTATPWVDFRCASDGTGRSLEKAFHLVMVASSADCIKVNVALCTVGKSLPEVFKAVCLEAAFLAFVY